MQTPSPSPVSDHDPVEPTTGSDGGSPLVDAAGRLDRNVACAGCGYNLRGQQPNGACPECGFEVGRSLRGYRLIYADPLWVRRLARGAFWVGCSLLVWPVVFGLGWMLAGWTIGSALGALGYWMLTTPREGGPPSRGLDRRRVARWGLVGAKAGFFVVLLCAAVATATAGYEVLGIELWLVLLAGCGLSWVAGSVAMLLYAGQLTRQIPHDALSRWFRYMLVLDICFLVGGPVVMSVGLLLEISRAISPHHGKLMMGSLGGVVVVTGIFRYAIELVLMFWFSRALYGVSKQGLKRPQEQADAPQA